MRLVIELWMGLMGVVALTILGMWAIWRPNGRQ
jgi:hypothetical protein